MFFMFRTLQAEYDRLREANEMRVINGNGLSDSMDEAEDHDEEMIAEAKLLRQHKGRLESRMRILEDHNKQLEAQLQRLRHLLDQVRTKERTPPVFTKFTLQVLTYWYMCSLLIRTFDPAFCSHFWTHHIFPKFCIW